MKTLHANDYPNNNNKQTHKMEPILTCQLSVLEISHTHSCPSLHPETMCLWSAVTRILDMQCVGASRPQMTKGTTKLLAMATDSSEQQQILVCLSDISFTSHKRVTDVS